MSFIYNPTVDQGATWSLEVEYLDNNDVPINLTGYTGEMQLRTDYSDATADLTLSSANGGIVINGAAGKVLVTITAAQSRALPQSFYLYDLELTSGASVIRLIQGQITVAGEVTRD